MRFLILLTALLAGHANAQDVIYKCAGWYTNQIKVAKENNCKQISGVTPKPEAIQPAKPPPARWVSRQSAAGTYEVEVSHNDELFLINDEKFSAKTYCFGVERGDQVKFISGSAYGACASAVFYNLRTEQTCEVWCD